jgi:hypothetical protein
MVRSITKDTVLCMSLAGRPSNIGTRFHNYLYAELELDFLYKAFTTTDLAAAIAGVRNSAKAAKMWKHELAARVVVVSMASWRRGTLPARSPGSTCRSDGQ